MWGLRWQLSRFFAAPYRLVVRFADEVRADLQLRVAALLGILGVVLLGATIWIGVERQKTLEAHAAQISPLDDSGNVFYVVERPVEAIIPASGRALAGSHEAVWIVAGLLAAVAGAATWYTAQKRQRQEQERLQRHRRPRTANLPSRLVAKRQSLRKLLRSESTDLSRNRLTVRQLMTETVVVVPPSASIQTLTNLLTSGPVRHVMICEYGGRILGVVADRDLRHRRGRRASDVMTGEPVCVPPGALLGPAISLMVEHQISCLPVVEEGRVRGILTSDDVTLALECLLQTRDATQKLVEPAADETALLSDVQTLCEAAHSGEPLPRPPLPATNDKLS